MSRHKWNQFLNKRIGKNCRKKNNELEEAGDTDIESISFQKVPLHEIKYLPSLDLRRRKRLIRKESRSQERVYFVSSSGFWGRCLLIFIVRTASCLCLADLAISPHYHHYHIISELSNLIRARRINFYFIIATFDWFVLCTSHHKN